MTTAAGTPVAIIWISLPMRTAMFFRRRTQQATRPMIPTISTTAITTTAANSALVKPPAAADPSSSGEGNLGKINGKRVESILRGEEKKTDTNGLTETNKQQNKHNGQTNKSNKGTKEQINLSIKKIKTI